MPLISNFFGILIYMYWKEHNPPHFHVHYGEHRAEIVISPISIAVGSLPPRVRSMVFEWTAEHQSELLANWERGSKHEPFVKIAGLDE